MLTKDKIIELFEKLNEKLKKQDEIGEIGIVGGAAMCLAYNARLATKDIDAIFQPTTEIREAVKEIAEEEDLPEDWLNDAVKGFFSNNQPEKKELINLSNLKVWTPEPEYLFAMKALSARKESKDEEDTRFLIKKIGIKNIDQALDILDKYYPNKIPIKTVFFLEELLVPVIKRR